MVYLYGVEKLTDFAEWCFSFGEYVDCILPRAEDTDEESTAAKEQTSNNSKRSVGGGSITENVDESKSGQPRSKLRCNPKCLGCVRQQLIWGVVGVFAASILAAAIVWGLKTFPRQRRENVSQAANAPSTFEPGNLLDDNQFGMKTSKGLSLRLVARSGNRVLLDGTFETNVLKGSDNEKNTRYSKEPYHSLPDGAATFSIPEEQGGGFVYVSNSEEYNGKGGVGALYFNNDGNVVDHKNLLSGTTLNCSGGKTPWNTWISCEENSGIGQCFEVDPFGVKQPQRTVLGGSGGAFEAVAVDNRNRSRPIFYVTHDSSNGELRQFIPNPNVMSEALRTNDFSKVLVTEGEINYLVLEPDKNDEAKGSFRWTASLDEGRKSARSHHRYSEGIDFFNGILYFVCKVERHLFALDMKTSRYTRSSTVAQMFSGGPDQIVIPKTQKSSLMARSNTFNSSNKSVNDIIYFTEDPDNRSNDWNAGIHGMSLSSKQRFTLLESRKRIGETSGVAFSPNGRFLLFAYQHEGTVFIAQREDGLPFLGHSMNLKYHTNTDLGDGLIRRLATFR